MRATLLVIVAMVLAGCTEPANHTPPDDTYASDAPGPTSAVPTSSSDSTTTTTTADRCAAEFTSFPSRIPTQDGCRCPWKVGCGPPAANATFPFTANATSVASNGSVQVTVHNDTGHNLTYQRTASCPLQAWASDGRQLWTMCGSDAIMTVRIAPGASDDSFFWRAVECLEGASTGTTMSCTKERPLAPGTYHLRQVFCPARDCPRAIAGLEMRVT